MYIYIYISSRADAFSCECRRGEDGSGYCGEGNIKQTTHKDTNK